jgi:CXXX repeat modification system protein
MVTSQTNVHLDELDFMALLNLHNKAESLHDLMQYLDNTEMKAILSANLEAVLEKTVEWWRYFEHKYNLNLAPGHRWHFDAEHRMVCQIEPES